MAEDERQGLRSAAEPSACVLCQHPPLGNEDVPHVVPGRIHFQFPKPFPLEKRLKDVLETYHDGKQLNEKYYLKTETILNRLKWNAETTTNHKFEYTEGV